MNKTSCTLPIDGAKYFYLDPLKNDYIHLENISLCGGKYVYMWYIRHEMMESFLSRRGVPFISKGVSSIFTCFQCGMQMSLLLVYYLSRRLLVSVGGRPSNKIFAGFYFDEVARVSGYMMYVMFGIHHVMWAPNPNVTYASWHGYMHGMYKKYYYNGRAQVLFCFDYWRMKNGMVARGDTESRERLVTSEGLINECPLVQQ